MSGGDAQISEVEVPHPALTLNGLSSNNVPEPFSGGAKLVVAVTRSVLIVPGPELIMTAARFQVGSLVNPAPRNGGAFGPPVAKPIIAES